MKKILFTSLFLFVVTPSYFAQIITFEKVYGTESVSRFYSTCLTKEGDYVSAGQNMKGIYIVKTNNLGDTIWTKTYVGSFASSIKQTDDNGYIVVGTKNFTASGNDVYLLKLNGYGDSLWSKAYGGVGNDRAYSVQVIPDDGFVITGYYDDRYAYLLKTDLIGDTIWTKIYDYGFGRHVELTNDGGMIISRGSAYSWSVLMKVDSHGNQQWSKRYRLNYGIEPQFVKQTIDGGYIFTGSTQTGTSGYANEQCFL